MLLPILFTLAYIHTGSADRPFNITELIVPQVVPSSVNEVEIECKYDADFTILTWFKGPSEFLRYTPGAAPTIKSFPVLGVGRIDVIVCGPTACKLRLGSLSEEASGLYRCDLERERRPYMFVTRSANMVVHGEEHRRPLLEGVLEEYGDGDEIQAKCTGLMDTEIRWYINGREIIEARSTHTRSNEYKRHSSRLIFLGIPPTMTVQCAEFRYGDLLGSMEVKARWREVNKGDSEVQELSDSAAINKLSVFTVFLTVIFKNCVL